MADTQPLALPVDYYALLGLVPYHLFPAKDAPAIPFQRRLRTFASDTRSSSLPSQPQLNAPPSPEMVDVAAAARSREAEHDEKLSEGARTLHLLEIELGRRILRDSDRRARYDSLMTMEQLHLRSGERLRRLRLLQEDARQELARERGELLDPQVAANLVQEGNEALRRGRQNEAVELLSRAIQLLPQDRQVHLGYARAILAVNDPLALSGYDVRMATTSLELVMQQEPTHPQAPALLAFCHGLLARYQDDLRGAVREFQRAVALNPHIGPAWRGMAAIAFQEKRFEAALEACEGALHNEPNDERALLIFAATLRRLGRTVESRDIAARIASLRGEGWTLDRVLHELTS